MPAPADLPQSANPPATGSRRSDAADHIPGGLRRRWAGLFAAVMAALGVLVGLNIHSAWQADASSRADSAIALRLETLLTLVNDAETGQRGYLLTGDTRYLTPYETARRAMPDLLVDLTRRLRQQGRIEPLRHLATLADARMAILTETVTLFRTGDTAAALAIVRTGRGIELMRQLRAEQRQLVAAETAAADAAHDTTVRTALLAGAGAIVLLAAPLLVLLMIRRDRRAALRQLSESEAQLRTIVETVPVGIVLAELPNGRIVGGNSYVEKLLRHPVLPTPALDGHGEWVAFHADGRRVAAHEYPLARMALAGEENPSLEVHYQRGDGTRAWMQILGRPVRDSGGELIGGVVALVDVDGERRARQALADSEARFRAMLNAVPTLTWECDPSGRITWLSEGWERYCGLPAAEIMQRGWSATLHPDELEQGLTLWHTALASGEGYTRRRRVRRASDGMWRWHQVSVHPVRRPDGTVQRWVGSVTDVHDLIEARSALGERETVLALFVERAPAALAMFDTEMRYLAVSRRFITDLLPGTPLEPADLIGHSHYEVFPDVPDRWRRNHQRVAAGESLSAQDDPYPRADGRTDWVNWELTPWRRPDGSVGGILMVNEVVTQRRQAALDLAHSQARLRMALEAGQVGTFDWDLRTGTLTWDERLRRLFGLPADAPISIEVFYACLHPDDVAPVSTLLEAALDPAQGGSFQAEYRVIGQLDRSERHVAARALVTFADGVAVRMAGVALDVTPLRRATQVLAREAQQLELLAERRGRALAESELRLAEAARMEALGRLAGGIAHDFNNVLQTVDGRLDLAMRLLPRDPERVRQHLDAAVIAVARGSAVTGRLLSFARRGELRAEAVAPAALLEDVAEILRPTIGRGITVVIVADPALPPLLADKAQLEAVLVNLANNARDAMADGGRLTFRADAVQPDSPDRPDGLAPGGFIRLAVEDEGEGMPPAVLARITEPFFTTKPRGKGTGLGLAMARGFAEQSGGLLRVASHPGMGTTVTLLLPQAGATPLVGAPAAFGPDPLPDKATVLIVEDEPDVRELFAAELEEHGFDTAEAQDAAMALRLVDAGLRPDVVMTDLSMPGELNGIGLLLALRRRLPRLPAVLVTGHLGEADADHLAAAEAGGPFALLRKPADGVALLDRITRVLTAGGRGGGSVEERG
jgi:PAS domain S-box-containing protein